MFLRRLFRHRDRDRELDEEIRFHIQAEIQRRVEQGEDRASAALAVRREFGNETLVRETTRAMWGSRLPEQLWQDLTYAARSARRKPGVTAVVVASLALGIGANLALFSVLYPALLRPLPVSHPEELVELLQKYPGEPRGNGYWTARSLEFYRDRNKVFSGLTATAIDHVTRIETSASETTVLVGESITGNYFSFLGLQPTLGRLIGPEDVETAVAVLSWSLWQSRFSSDPAVLGRRITIGEVPMVIIGVAPRDYTGLLPNAQTSVWTPVKPNTGLNLIARLRPDVTLNQAREEMKVLYRFTIEERTSESKDPQAKKLQIELAPAREGLNGLRDRVGQPLWLLMALVSVLLVLACANVGGILLAQAATREREIALRSGLGASRGRLIRQVLTESCLLSAAGTLIGIAVAWFGTAVLLRMLDGGRPHERVHLTVEVNTTVVLFVVAVALGTGLVFGLAPAFHTLRPASLQALRQTDPAARNRSQRIFGKTLVAVQVAIALLLVTFGTLFSSNLAMLRSKNLGFRPDRVLLLSVDSGRSGYRGQHLANLMHQALDRLKGLPGAASVSLASPTPLMGAGASGWVTAEGCEEAPEEKRRIPISWVAPRYFETIGIPILAGRDFDSTDEASGHSALVSEAAARYYFAGRDPIGRKITLDKVTMTKGSSAYTVVGVVGNSNYREIQESDRRLIYLSAFAPGRVIARTFVIRTAIRPEALSADARRVVLQTAPALSFASVTSLPAQIDSAIARERLIATLSGFFAVVGALLAGIGLYGLLAYTVTRRTNELGIRMALGATAGRVLRMILGEALLIVCAGLVVGIPLVTWSLAAAGRLLPDIMVPRAFALTMAGVMLMAVGALASWIPARRAARLEAMQCLRQE